jgi:hypothetical protein
MRTCKAINLAAKALALRLEFTPGDPEEIGYLSRPKPRNLKVYYELKSNQKRKQLSDWEV